MTAPSTPRAPGGGTSRAAVSLGGNLGDSERLLARAREAFAAEPRIEILATSAARRTPPQGVRDQPDFLNQVLMLRTDLSPWELLDRCLRIEAELGRVRGPVRWGPRTLDADIVAYDGLAVRDSRLTIPHAALPLRPFLLDMLREVEGEDLLP